MSTNSLVKIQDQLLFESILQFSHPLCTEVIQSLVQPKPGIYLIRRGTQVIYVGRSMTNLQKRLTSHCSNRKFRACFFSIRYTKTPLETYRLESAAIFYFRKIDSITNQIHAAVPHKTSRKRF